MPCRILGQFSGGTLGQFATDDVFKISTLNNLYLSNPGFAKLGMKITRTKDSHNKKICFERAIFKTTLHFQLSGNGVNMPSTVGRSDP